MELPSYQQMNKTSVALIEAYQRAARVVMANYDKDPDANWQDLMNMSEIYHKWLMEVMQHPEDVLQAQMNWWHDMVLLFEQYPKLQHSKTYEPIIKPNPRDKRFSSPLWEEYGCFFMIQQLYLIFSKHCFDFIAKHPSKDPTLTKQIQFFTERFIDAMSPTNFVLTNPQVLQKTVESRGENLIQGYQNFLNDLETGQGHFIIKMTDMSVFQVGKNLAGTPGKVIFENNLIQLIQYAPTSETVYAKPLLMIPPWINKYYILDLRQHNSLVRWAVDNGFTVFIISWINPDQNYAETTFADYMTEGVLAALDAIEEETGQTGVNALGFCVGGTLLATTLSYLAAKKQNRIHSATFLTTLIDFSDPGEIGVFIDENQIEALNKRMKFEGYLDGRLLMNTFNMLRANDLMWSYYVNNYLCGQEPFPFDVLFWNSDSTNLPAAMHRYYLKHFYVDNDLIKGNLPILDEIVDIRDVQVPTYFISTEHDHIAPWKTTFIGAKALKGDVTFVLGGSGHIAGIVNPPENHKYQYRTASRPIQDFASAEAWYQNSHEIPGSWWTHWGEWLTRHSGQKIPARQPALVLRAIEDAPGTYVKKRLL